MWAFKIIASDFLNGKHSFSATDSFTGETVYGTYGNYPPSMQILPASFFKALDKFIQELQQKEPAVVPHDIVEINQENTIETQPTEYSEEAVDTVVDTPRYPYDNMALQWRGIVDHTTKLSKWNGWKTTMRPMKSLKRKGNNVK